VTLGRRRTSSRNFLTQITREFVRRRINTLMGTATHDTV
jgi:hypothetical protein